MASQSHSETLPISAVFSKLFRNFHRLMLTNLLSLPLTGLLIPCALLTVVLSTLGCCPQFLIQATEWLVSTLVWLLKVISTM